MGDNYGGDYFTGAPLYPGGADYPASPDTAGLSTTDPYAAGPDNNAPVFPAGPEDGGAVLPGGGQQPFFPAGVSAGQLLNAGWNVGGQLFGGADNGTIPNLGVGPQVNLAPYRGSGGLMPVNPRGGGIGILLQAVSMRVGRHVTAGVVIAMLRKFGAALVSSWTGLSPAQLLSVWASKKRGGRRRRGITGRQLSNAARVARTLHKMAQTFRHSIGPGYSSGHHSRQHRGGKKGK
jgi:hypothetical protein